MDAVADQVHAEPITHVYTANARLGSSTHAVFADQQLMNPKARCCVTWLRSLTLHLLKQREERATLTKICIKSI